MIEVIVPSNDQSIHDLVRVRRHANRRINRICKAFLESQKSSYNQRVVLLHQLGFIIRLCYRIRTKNYRKFNFFKKNYIIFACFLILRLQIFYRLLKVFKRFGLRFNLLDKVSNKFIVVINMPKHAFNYVRHQANVHSSFGEYFVNHYGKDYDIVSLDEYVRSSATVEDIVKAEDDLASLERKIINSSRKVKAYFQDLRYFLQQISVNKIFSIFGNLHLIFVIDSIRYEKVLLSSYCSNAFAPIFSDLFCYHDAVSKKVHAVMYADNIIVPPFFSEGLSESFNGSSKDFLSQMNPSLLACKQKYIGHSKVYPQIYYGFLRYFFGKTSCEVSFPTKSSPVILGFEKRFNHEKEFQGTIVIFDNPPELTQKQNERSLTRDFTVDFKFLEEFYLDILAVATQNNYKVIVKPKYDLENYSVLGYRDFLKCLEKKYGKQIIIVNPYTRMLDVVQHSDLVLNHPGTSSKNFSEFYGKLSYFYVPKRYKNVFVMKNYKSNDTLYGKADISEVLKKKLTWSSST